MCHAASPQCFNFIQPKKALRHVALHIQHPFSHTYWKCTEIRTKADSRSRKAGPIPGLEDSVVHPEMASDVGHPPDDGGVVAPLLRTRPSRKRANTNTFQEQPCPVCGNLFPARLIETHADRCAGQKFLDTASHRKSSCKRRDGSRTARGGWRASHFLRCRLFERPNRRVFEGWDSLGYVGAAERTRAAVVGVLGLALGIGSPRRGSVSCRNGCRGVDGGANDSALESRWGFVVALVAGRRPDVDSVVVVQVVVVQARRADRQRLYERRRVLLYRWQRRGDATAQRSAH